MQLKLQYWIVAVLVCFPGYVVCQMLPWPIDPYGVEYRVDSSYGPRNASGTFFHKGLDLNKRYSYGDDDLNFPVQAASYGAIFGIGKTSNGLKWIGIDYGGGRTFAYLHIFPDNTGGSSGNFAGLADNSAIRSYKRIYTDSERYAVNLLHPLETSLKT